MSLWSITYDVQSEPPASCSSETPGSAINAANRSSIVRSISCDAFKMPPEALDRTTGMTWSGLISRQGGEVSLPARSNAGIVVLPTVADVDVSRSKD